jgi:hypothetical protein
VLASEVHDWPVMIGMHAQQLVLLGGKMHPVTLACG